MSHSEKQNTGLAGTVSVDVDPVDLHLLGYGVNDAPADSLVYRTAIPRLLERFSAAGVQATFFFVARDALEQRQVIAAVADAGHEVASHSMTHAMAFASLPAERLREELRVSRERLEDVCGQAVTGFRSPNWDLDARSANEVLEAGYLYDASGYPTPMLLAARVALLVKGGGSARGLKVLPITWSRLPYEWELGAGRSIQEFPVSVSTWLRFPVYHTVAYLLGDARLVRMIEAVGRAGVPLSYPVHAVDVLGLAEDSVDVRLAPHPGMSRSLESKLEMMTASLGAVAKHFEPISYAERMRRGEPGVVAVGS